MENLRLVLIVSLAAVLMLIYQAWLHDYGQAPKGTAVTQSESRTTPSGGHTPEVPVVPASSASPVSSAPSPAAPFDLPQGQLITVETDVLRVEISPRGGTIASAWLLDYPVSPKDLADKVRLMKPELPNFFVAQSGLSAATAQALPNHDALFSSESRNYRLGSDQSSLSVDLTWTNDAGVKVRKSLRFTRGSYLVETSQQVTNATDEPMVAREYAQLQRTELQDPNATRFVSTYTGGAYYSPADKYKKVLFKDFKDIKDVGGQKLYGQVADGWIAMIQHYFLAAWIPPRGLEETFYTNVLDGNRYVIGQWSPAVSVAPGASHTFTNQLFVGPKLQDALASIAPGLELTVDYGWLTVIAQPIHWLLDQIYSVVGNWGWSIIVLTILIKLAFYKLSETSYKSMANMRQLTPRMAALKDRYGDDKERLNQAMMELYKTEKINPLGGCLPIFVQIPVFIALYWVLLESVELRQAPFILWIDNLSAPDPYYVLPLIMGVSMFVQSKLNPAPPDPMQAKLMMSLPFIFTVFFAFFPSGLVLYWTVNNILSIAQQWHITRNIEQAAAKRKR
jgi:YidC/Oxa1 family membrane protein insertase